MRNEVRLSRAFGFNEAGLADVPCKVSGVTLSRIVNGDDSGCSHCFPHGIETFNSHEVTPAQLEAPAPDTVARRFVAL